MLYRIHTIEVQLQFSIPFDLLILKFWQMLNRFNKLDNSSEELSKMSISPRYATTLHIVSYETINFPASQPLSSSVHIYVP